jgi:hypothetical protein
LSALALTACTASQQNAASSSTEPSAFQGTVSNLVDMSFDTEVRAPSADEAERLIDAQLYWLVGPFHELGGDPRLTWAEKTKTGTATDGDVSVAKFHVKMSVAWPKAVALPAKYEIVLPSHVDSDSQSKFYDKYKDKCIGADHDQDWSNAWYNFDPKMSGCELADADVIKVSASLAKKTDNTVDTYPEYDRIWSDKKFQVVAVFGRDTPGSTNDDDSGALEYKKYINGLKAESSLSDVHAAEETFDDNGQPGKQTTIDAKLANDRTLHAVVFLLSKPSWSGDEFAKRYNPATEEADYVAYAGHAGLGGNIQKLQSLGTFKRGQYQVFVYDGCDTFAYIDKTLFEKKKAANGAADDPEGTRDLDLVLNALPTPWTSGDPSVLKLTRALINDAQPTKFEAILQMFPRSAAPVVVGDEDNKFTPQR